jgi:hypothetical protein
MDHLKYHLSDCPFVLLITCSNIYRTVLQNTTYRTILQYTICGTVLVPYPRCESRGGNPAPLISWFLDNEELPSTQHNESEAGHKKWAAIREGRRSCLPIQYFYVTMYLVGNTWKYIHVDLCLHLYQQNSFINAKPILWSH